MGKSSKKSTPKVDAAPAVTTPGKQLKKGKREAEELIKKEVSVKKQKKGGEVEEVINKKKSELKTQKKKVVKDDTSTSEDTSSSDSEEELKNPAIKPVVTLKKSQLSATKNGTAKNGKPSASDDSDTSDDSESDEDEVPKGKSLGASKNGSVPSVKKKQESSSESESDDENSDSDEDAGATKKLPAPAKNVPVTASKKKNESSDDSDSDETSDSDDDDDKSTGVANAVKPVKSGKKESSSEEESSDDEPSKAPTVKKPVISKKNSSDESSSEDEEESSEEEEEEPSKTPQKKDTDVEMVDSLPKKGGLSSEQKAPKTPATPHSQASGSKTLFVGNLSFSVEQADVENFFKDCGEVVDVRFATHPDGAFKGFGHVEFATAEAAQKALKELNGQELLGRGVRLDMAAERGSYTPQSGKDGSSFQSQGKTIYIRGFDRNSDEDEIKGALREHFESCGEITRISVPTGDDGLKGFAYIDFTNNDAINKALEFDNSEFNDSTITVEEARPRGDSGGGGRGRGGRSGGRDSGGRFGGRRGGRFGSDGGRGRFGSDGGRGRFGSDGGRGRFGSDGGRGGRFGGRGRGNFNKPNMAAAGTGKKTTFDD